MYFGIFFFVVKTISSTYSMYILNEVYKKDLLINADKPHISLNLYKLSPLRLV